MSKKITISNFLRMNPDIPEYSLKNQHYLLSGIDPQYYLAQSAVQEKTSSPLAASGSFVPFYTITPSDGKADYIAPSTYSSYDLLVATNVDLVYGIGGGTAGVSLGGPSGIVGSGSLRTAIGFGGYIMWNNSKNGPWTRTFTSSTWTAVSGSFGVGGTTLTRKFMVPFLDFCAMSDNTAAGTSGEANHVIRKIDKNLLMSIVLDLGPGWNTVGMENYNNKYLAVAASYAADNTYLGTLSSDVNYLFLWDGYQATYNSSIRIPGSLIEMKMIGDTLYFVVLERASQYALYKLSGTKIVPVFPIAIDTVKNTIGGNFSNILFNYSNSLGINLSSKGQYMYSAGLYGTAKYILTPTDNRFHARAGNSGILYGSPDGSIFSAYTPSTWGPISYRSQWIPVGDLSQIVVNYAAKPVGAGDAIQVTLDGFDEDGNASTSLPLTTITSATAYNQYKTYLDTQGFEGNMVRVTLTTTTAGTWQPIIRSLDLITP